MKEVQSDWTIHETSHVNVFKTNGLTFTLWSSLLCAVFITNSHIVSSSLIVAMFGTYLNSWKLSRIYKQFFFS
jgi:hypothetical protein